MSRFTTKLVAEEIEEGLWLLHEPLVYESDLLGKTIVVPTGFETDFASVPRIPLAFLLTGGKANKAAVIHDYLYAKQEVSRAQADSVFLEAMKVSNQPGWRANLMWAGVRIGGWVGWKVHTDRNLAHNESAREAP
jgi:hypothetical protein